MYIDAACLAVHPCTAHVCIGRACIIFFVTYGLPKALLTHLQHVEILNRHYLRAARLGSCVLLACFLSS